MKFFFPETDAAKIVTSLNDAMSGRKLGKMVDIESKGSEIKITISKLGKTTIEFSQTPADGGVEWSKTKEKVALSHRAVKGEVIEKIYKIVVGVGGKIL